jgi:hypothetical protein
MDNQDPIETSTNPVADAPVAGTNDASAIASTIEIDGVEYAPADIARALEAKQTFESKQSDLETWESIKSVMESDPYAGIEAIQKVFGIEPTGTKPVQSPRSFQPVQLELNPDNFASSELEIAEKMTAQFNNALSQVHQNYESELGKVKAVLAELMPLHQETVSQKQLNAEISAVKAKFPQANIDGSTLQRLKKEIGTDNAVIAYELHQLRTSSRSAKTPPTTPANAPATVNLTKASELYAALNSGVVVQQ